MSEEQNDHSHVIQYEASDERWGQQMNTEDHEFTQKQLSAYLDDEVSQANRAIIESHLETCHECRADLALLRTVAESLAESEIPPLPDQADTRLLGAIREADAKEKQPAPVDAEAKRPLWSRPWVSAAAGLAAVFLVVVVLSVPSPSSYVETDLASEESVERSTPQSEPAPTLGEEPAKGELPEDADGSLELSAPPEEPQAESDSFAGSGLPEDQAVAPAAEPDLTSLSRADIPEFLEPIDTDEVKSLAKGADPALTKAFEAAPSTIHHFEKVEFEEETAWILVASENGKKMAWIFDEEGTFVAVLF